MDRNNIKVDEGYAFGLGCFETILVQKKPIFLEEHLSRLNRGLSSLGIDKIIEENDILEYINNHKKEAPFALKVMVSKNNTVYSTREIPYKDEDYSKGVRVKVSSVMRNESSPFTYIKSLCYGDNIIEKRLATEEGFGECLFLNSNGEVTEGAVSNIFFIFKNEIVTPDVQSGLLEGIVRGKILKRYKDIQSGKISLDEVLKKCEGAFITNSLLGVMWINEIEGMKLPRHEEYEGIKIWYEEEVRRENEKIK